MATLEGMTIQDCLKTNEGGGYMGGESRFGVNRVLFRPYPITRIMNGVLEFIGFEEPVAE